MECPNEFTPLEKSWRVSRFTQTNLNELTIDALPGKIVRVKKQPASPTQGERSVAFVMHTIKKLFSGKYFNCHRAGHSAPRCIRHGGGAYRAKTEEPAGEIKQHPPIGRPCTASTRRKDQLPDANDAARGELAASDAGFKVLR